MPLPNTCENIAAMAGDNFVELPIQPTLLTSNFLLASNYSKSNSWWWTHIYRVSFWRRSLTFGLSCHPSHSLIVAIFYRKIPPPCIFIFITFTFTEHTTPIMLPINPISIHIKYDNAMDSFWFHELVSVCSAKYSSSWWVFGRILIANWLKIRIFANICQDPNIKDDSRQLLISGTGFPSVQCTGTAAAEAAVATNQTDKSQPI